jgi:hypothetical protein
MGHPLQSLLRFQLIDQFVVWGGRRTSSFRDDLRACESVHQGSALVWKGAGSQQVVGIGDSRKKYVQRKW